VDSGSTCVSGRDDGSLGTVCNPVFIALKSMLSHQVTVWDQVDRQRYRARKSELKTISSFDREYILERLMFSQTTIDDLFFPHKKP